MVMQSVVAGHYGGRRGSPPHTMVFSFCPGFGFLGVLFRLVFAAKPHGFVVVLVALK